MHQDVTQKVERLVRELQQLYNDQLVSVCVYGSSLLGGDEPLKEKHKNINVLVILDQMTFAEMEKASSVAKWWHKEARSMPMFMSEAEWHRSDDVFALECTDIRENHHIAYGKDLYSTVEVHPADLRLVCELELNRKLMLLRQNLLMHRDRPKALIEVLQSSVNSFAALFRGVLRLVQSGQTVPHKAQPVFEQIAPHIDGYDPTPFLRVLRSKERGKEIPASDVLSVYAQYIAQVSLVVTYVDQCMQTVIAEKEGALS